MLECIVDHQSSHGARRESYSVETNTSPPALEPSTALNETSSRPILRRAVSAPVETVENTMPIIKYRARRGSDTGISGLFNSLVNAAYDKHGIDEQGLRRIDAPEDDEELSLFPYLQHRVQR